MCLITIPASVYRPRKNPQLVMVCHPPRKTVYQAVYCSVSDVLVSLGKDGLCITHSGSGAILPSPTQGWIGLGTCIASCSERFAVGSKCGKVMIYDAINLNLIKVVFPSHSSHAVGNVNCCIGNGETLSSVVSLLLICDGAVIVSGHKNGVISLTALPPLDLLPSSVAQCCTSFLHPPISFDGKLSDNMAPLLVSVHGDPSLLGVVSGGGNLDIYRIAITSSSLADLMMDDSRRPPTSENRGVRIQTPKAKLVASLSFRLFSSTESGEIVGAEHALNLVVVDGISILRREAWFAICIVSIGEHGTYLASAAKCTAISSEEEVSSNREVLVFRKRHFLGERVCSYSFHGGQLAVVLPSCVCILDLIQAIAPFRNVPSSTADRDAFSTNPEHLCKKIIFASEIAVGQCSLMSCTVVFAQSKIGEVIFLMWGGKNGRMLSIRLD